MQTQLSTAAGVIEAGLELPLEPSDALAPGDKAGPWIVERELGRGGMGAVYAVVHEDIGKRAALKVMHRRLGYGASAERILLEARVVNQVAHPNIVDIFETGAMPDGRPYIVMERLDGVPLSLRADQGKILPDQVIAILLQVCDALIAAHASGIVHRDLKLDNVFLLDNPDDPATPRVKVLDWGIAKVITNDAHNTIEGQLVGTPQYLAPEQARGAAVCPNTDVYSLGVMAYELFLEQLPFEAETSAEIMAMHLRAVPPLPSELWPDIPADLEKLLLAMLAKDPDARPSMLSVARALELVVTELAHRRAIAAEPPGATPAPEMPRCVRWSSAPGLAPTEPASWRRRKRRWQVALGSLAVAAGTLIFAVTREDDSAAAAEIRPQASGFRLQAKPTPVETPSVEHLPSRTSDVATAIPDMTRHMSKLAAAEHALEAKPEAQSPKPEARSLKPSPAPARRAAHHHRPSHHARKAPVTPHRSPLLDPDGTLDPYP